MFVGTVTEKLMTYGLGRGLEALRHAARCARSSRDAAQQNYRFSAIVLGIVKSAPFQMKKAQRRRCRRLTTAFVELRSDVEAQRTARRATMFITKKHLPRRTFLRGVGATLALPLLDSMVPARTLLAQTAARPRRGSASSTCRTARS